MFELMDAYSQSAVIKVIGVGPVHAPTLTGALTTPIVQVVDESVVPSPLARKFMQRAAKSGAHPNLHQLMA